VNILQTRGMSNAREYHQTFTHWNKNRILP
jgi:hypothetical protein